MIVITVRGTGRHHFSTDGAGCSAAILDDKLLAHYFRHLLKHDAGHHGVGTAGREHDDDAYGFVGIGLRDRGCREINRQSKNRYRHTIKQFHVLPPRSMGYRRSTAALDVRSTAGGAIHDPDQLCFDSLVLSDLRPLLHHRTTTITNARIGTNSHAASNARNHSAHALKSRIALIVPPCATSKTNGCLADSSLWQNSPGTAHWLLENLSRDIYVLVPVPYGRLDTPDRALWSAFTLAEFRAVGAPRSLAAHARDVVLFGACYVALDWSSSIYPLGPFNITPWNPPPALSIVWMMLGGLGYAPIIFGTIFAADFIIRHAPGGLLITALTSVVLAGGYTAIAGTLRYFLKSDSRLRDTRQLWLFVAITAVGTAIVAGLYVGVLWATDFLVRESISAAVFRFWLG